MDPRSEAREAREAEKAAQSFSHIVEEFAHALNLMNELVSTDPCEVDAWGTCVPHGHLGVRKLECPHAKARRMLNEYDKFWLN